jgi:hypothetical protein
MVYEIIAASSTRFPCFDIRCGTSRRGLSVVEAVGALRLVVVRAEQTVSVDGLPSRAMLGCLGRQSQASISNGLTKALVLSNAPRR